MSYNSCDTIKEPDDIFKGKNWNCNGYNSQLGQKILLSLYDFDVVKARYAANRGQGREGIRLGTQSQKHDKMYISNISWSNDGNWDYAEVEWKGFIAQGQKSKCPTGGITQGTTDIPIQAHPNWKSATAWNAEFKGNDKHGLGEGGSPNMYGRVLDVESGEFVRFGPLPDGLDGRPPARGKCEKNQNGPWCKLQGITNYLGPAQVIYKYKILTSESKWWKDYHLYLGTISYPSSRQIPTPTLPEHPTTKYPSDWLFVNFNVTTTTLSTAKPDEGKFYELEFEFLSSGIGGWNQLIYPKGRGLNLDGDSGFSFDKYGWE